MSKVFVSFFKEYQAAFGHGKAPQFFAAKI